MSTATEAREHPILFSGPMIRAILAGTKTQTRRVVKPQPEWVESSGRWRWRTPKGKVNPGCCTEVVTASREWWEYLTPNQLQYQPGDRLWVKEAWAVEEGLDKSRGFVGWPVWYRADDAYRWLGNGGYGFHTGNPRGRWRSSRFMPHWASRITLEVTDVRVERVQEITEEDAKAEGVTPFPYDPEGDCWTDGKHRTAFEYLWGEINGPRGFGWDANPWCWVVSFRRVAP